MLFRKPIGETMRVFRFNLVKIILLKSNNCALALRKRLFCNAKQPLLPCKIYAFGTPNNRFCNSLKHSELCNSFACKKYLHLCRLLFAHKINWVRCKNLMKMLYLFLITSILHHNYFFLRFLYRTHVKAADIYDVSFKKLVLSYIELKTSFYKVALQQKSIVS